MNFEVKTEAFESEIPELQFYMNFIPSVDGECVTDIIQAHIDEEILIDPYIDEDLANDVIFDNARIGIEIPKDYFDDDCEYKDEYISEYSEMLERAYGLATREDMAKKDLK